MRKIETVKFKAGTKKLVIGIALVISAFIVVLGLMGEPSPTERWIVVGTAALTLGISALVVYLPRLETSVGTNVLSLNLTPLCHYKFPISEIEELRIVDVNAAAYGGIGLRFGGGATGLIMSSGKGVEFLHHGKKIVFSAKDPERVVKEIQS